MRLKALFSLLIVGFVGTALAQATPPAPPQNAPAAAAPTIATVTVIEEKKVETVVVEPVRLVEPPKPPPPQWEFGFHGFVSGSIGYQNAITGGAGDGKYQTALWAERPFLTDKLVFFGDVRQTRLNFSMRGPQVFGDATPRGVVELDFFGGESAGAFGNESIFPRLRLAYVELNWGGNFIMRVGQFHNLIFSFIPASGAHIGFPIAYAGGLVGWRSPGITLLWNSKLGETTNMELGLQANRPKWSGEQIVPGAAAPSCPAGQNAPVTNCLNGGYGYGVASGLPQLMARLQLTGGKTPSAWNLLPSVNWLAYAAFAYQVLDLSGAGYTYTGPAPYRDSAASIVGQAGFNLHVGPLTAIANAWVGKNAGELLGHSVYIQSNGASSIAGFIPPLSIDLHGYGAFGQVGIGGPDGFSFWLFGGMDSVLNWEQAENVQAPRLRNVNTAAMIQYRSGPVVFAFEWIHYFTTNVTYAAGGNGYGTTRTVNADQPVFTTNFFF